MEQDSLLIERVLEGDTAAFSELVNKYQNIIYSYLLKMTLSIEDAEDLTQEVFIKVYNNLYKFDRRSKLLTWVFKIAINTFKSQYKKRKRLTFTYDEDALSRQACGLTDLPEYIFERKEHLREISLLINSLEVIQRSALILKYIEGFSYKEIGEILGVSEESAKMKAHRAKKNICNKAVQNMKKRGVLNELEMPY